MNNEEALAILAALDSRTAFQLGNELTILLGILAAWVSMDARDRGWSRIAAFSWGVAILFLSGIVLVGYLILRPRMRPGNTESREATAQAARTCRYCQMSYPGDPAYCPHCSSQLKGADEIHRNS